MRVASGVGAGGGDGGGGGGAVNGVAGGALQESQREGIVLLIKIQQAVSDSCQKYFDLYVRNLTIN